MSFMAGIGFACAGNLVRRQRKLPKSYSRSRVKANMLSLRHLSLTPASVLGIMLRLSGGVKGGVTQNTWKPL